MDSKKLLLTWEAFDEAVFAGAEEFRNSPWVMDGNCTGIYGIPRGGLVLAIALSHHLDLPLLPSPQKRCIVVDDVIETGRTMLKLLDDCNKAGITDQHIAAWTWVSKNEDLSTGYYKFVDPDVWIVFPWEDWTQADKDKAGYERRTALKVPPAQTR